MRIEECVTPNGFEGIVFQHAELAQRFNYHCRSCSVVFAVFNLQGKSKTLRPLFARQTPTSVKPPRQPWKSNPPAAARIISVSAVGRSTHQLRVYKSWPEQFAGTLRECFLSKLSGRRNEARIINASALTVYRRLERRNHRLQRRYLQSQCRKTAKSYDQ